MPTYDLQCGECTHTFEAFRQGFLRDEDRLCPECGATDATQLLTGGFVAIIGRRGDSAQPAPATSAATHGCGGHCGCGGH